MKKILYSVLLALLIFMPAKVFAAGYIAPSTGSISVQQGSSTSFTITASNAIGDVVVTSSNPGVATVSPGSWATGAVGAGQTTSGRFTVTGVGVGSTTIRIVIDGYSFDDEDVSGTQTITVNVTPKPASAPSTPSTPTTPSNPTPSASDAPSGTADTRSTDTSLSKLTVNGKALSNNNNVFSLEVGNYVEKIDIAATLTDTKATVTGTGSKDLKVGENNFNIVVTAERGNTTTYTVKVVKKEFNTLGDLDELLKLKKDVEIRFNDSDKLTKEQLDKISNSKNKVTLTKMSDDNKTILYSYVLDGTKIKSVKEFNPNITTEVENNSDMEEALNYADGIYLDFSNCGDIPNGILLRYYVGDKYKDNHKVNLYAYSSNKITQLKENVIVKDGYIEIEVTDSIKHFISKAKVLNAEVKENINVWMIVSFVLIGIIMVSFVVNVVKRAKTNKPQDSVEKDISNTIKVAEVVEKNNFEEVSTPEIVETVQGEQETVENVDVTNDDQEVL